MAQMIKVAGVQMDVAIGNVAENLAAMEQHIRQCAADGALLVVFPECALSGYCYESLDEARPHAQPVPGPATEHLAEVCGELGCYTVLGMLEADGPRLYNTCVLVGPEGLIGKYRKIHLPYLGIDRFTTPGELPPQIWQCGPLKIGMNICYDGSFPETSRCMALDGADLVVLPTNWPPGADATADYIINARAHENQIYYLAVDRVGDERGFHFIGKSRLAHPSGHDIAAALHDRPEVITGEIDPAVARNKHLVRVPGKHEIDRFLDRRPELYERITAPKGETDRPAILHQRIWAPWRLAYIADASSAEKSPDQKPACFICQGLAQDPSQDREHLIVERGDLCVTILNRYPYNNGHLLVAPHSHKARLDELTAAEHNACMQEVTRLVNLLERGLNAEGFNVGLNLGRVAGAGLPGHLHWHVVPRWNGDTNFMPALAGTKVIPQSLDALWEYLREL